MYLYLGINLLGLLVFIGIATVFSKKRKEISWRTVGVLALFNLFLAWFLTSFFVGRNIVLFLAAGFQWIVDVSYTGIAFAFPDWVHVERMNFFTGSLLPILMIVPLFDILSYIGVMPFVIRWLGKLLSKITGAPHFESFFAIEMMFLGNAEAIAVSKFQLRAMNAQRNLTVAMMTMSCVTAAVVGVYAKIMPAEFVLTAVPLNVVNALLVTTILNPVKVSEEENNLSITGHKREREPFFSFLGNSIISSGRLILIIVAMVIAFVALVALIDQLLALINPAVSLEKILGFVMFPFAWLLGLDFSEAFQLAEYMGMKIVTNEFVVMGQAGPIMDTFSHHMQAVLTVFVTSFANFASVGVILSAFKGLIDEDRIYLIPKNVGYLMLSGILVSLLSAAFAGLFIW